MTTISFEELVDLAEGRLSAEERAAFQARVDADPAAAAELVRLQHLFTVMRSDKSVDVPDHVTRRALRLFTTPSAPERPGIVQRLVATLRFDSAQAPLAMGVRQEAPTGRTLLLSAGEYDIDLRIHPNESLWEVSGQLLGGVEGATGEVELRSPQQSVSASLSELSEFTLPPVPAGMYDLLLYQAGVEIVAHELELGPSKP